MFGVNFKQVIEDAYLVQSINIQNNWYMRLIVFYLLIKLLIDSFALQYNLL